MNKRVIEVSGEVNDDKWRVSEKESKSKSMGEGGNQ